MDFPAIGERVVKWRVRERQMVFRMRTKVKKFSNEDWSD